MTRGSLRIYLGAAPGVGKTFAMLNEGWRGRARGTDVVIGLVETHGRTVVAGQIRDVEIVPRRQMTYRGATFEEMDVDAILARNPEVALVDELAHTNVPGSRNAKRWQDVEELLEAGIKVISTLNIQHLASLNDVIERITGVPQRETIPDAVVRSADQVELIDMSPEAIRRRMAHGNIYAPEKVSAALTNYFRPGNLGALRELALLWVADRVDESLHDYMVAHGIEEQWETRERVMVALAGAPGGETLIRRASRIARRAKAELIGVHVRTQDGLAAAAPAFLEQHRMLLEQLGGQFRETVGEDVPTALLQFARAEQVTQIVLGSTRRSRLAELVRGSVINSVIRGSGSIDVHVISHEPSPDETARPLPRPPRLAALSPRRRMAGMGVALVGLPLLAVILNALRDDVELSTVVLVYLSLCVAASAVGGLWAGVLAAVGGFLLANVLFTQPYYSIRVGEPQFLVALVVFVVVAVVVSVLADLAARRASEASRARAEAAALARLAGSLLDSDDPLPHLVHDLRATFQLDSVAVLRRYGTGWAVEASAGQPIPASPGDGTDALILSDDATLVLAGPRTPADDRRLLASFAAQLAVAVATRQLRAQAEDASVHARAHELRSALLAAVSHDLRTPLASIKASATSLLQADVAWQPDTTEEFLTAIVAEADRLNTLVGNLLDMSRLQSGALQVHNQPVGLDEVVPAALRGLPTDGTRIDVDISETLPLVQADPALLERVVANLVGNALEWSPPGEPVRIHAGAVAGQVHLCVTDRGPGIPPAYLDKVFQPFQRLGDGAPGGVGLGLAVARGFTQAIGGELFTDDTPGGGTTMTVSLKALTEPAGGGLTEPDGGGLR
ncbi:MAG: ATP-binding protein [Egibacteraceae bacterium]